MPKRYLLLFPLLLAGLVAACGGGDDAVGPVVPDPPEVRYFPDPADTVVVVIPDSVRLTVEVDPPQPFSAEFTLGDSVVSTGTELLLIGDRVGQARYRVVVNVDGKWLYDTEWQVRIVTEIERPTPVPTAPSALPGDAPGKIAVAWNRPADHLVDPEAPIEGYEIAWSTASFGIDEFEFQNLEYVTANPAGIAQGADLVGLTEGQTYYIRIRTIDTLGRQSWPTAEVTTAATGRFTLSGNVWQLDAVGMPTPVGSVLVVAGPARVTTLEDGRFVLPGLPNFDPIVLTAEEGSGLYTLPIRTTPLEPVDRNLDLVLVPRQNVDILDQDGFITTETLREFLLQATLHESNIPPFDFHPWREYPVKVWVWEYTTGDVNYHDSFDRAIDLWNDGATGDDRLLQRVSVSADFDPTGDESLEGVMVRLYDPIPGSNLGQVTFVRPASGAITRTDPELLQLGLRAGMPTQELVDRVVAHELGHALGLTHTPSQTNLMHATSDMAAGVPTPEEVFVARYIRHGGRDMQSNWIIDP